MNIRSSFHGFAAAGGELSHAWEGAVSHPLIMAAGPAAQEAVRAFYASGAVPAGGKKIFNRVLENASHWMRQQDNEPRLGLLATPQGAADFLASAAPAMRPLYRRALHYSFARFVQAEVVAENPYVKNEITLKKKKRFHAVAAFDAAAQKTIAALLDEKTPGWDQSNTHAGRHFYALAKLSSWLEQEAISYSSLTPHDTRRFLETLPNPSTRQSYASVLRDVFTALGQKDKKNPFPYAHARPEAAEGRYENLFTLLGQSGEAYVKAAHGFLAEKRAAHPSAAYGAALEHAAAWLLANGTERLAEITYNQLLRYRSAGFDGRAGETRDIYFSFFLKFLRHLKTEGLPAGIHHPAGYFSHGRPHGPGFAPWQPFTLVAHNPRHKPGGAYDWQASRVQVAQHGAVTDFPAVEFLLAMTPHASGGQLERLLSGGLSRSAILAKMAQLKKSHPQLAEANAPPARAAAPARPVPKPVPLSRIVVVERAGSVAHNPALSALVTEANALLKTTMLLAQAECLMLARFVRYFSSRSRLKPGEAMHKKLRKPMGQSCWDLARRVGWVEMRDSAHYCARPFSALFNDPARQLMTWADRFVDAHERDMRARFDCFGPEALSSRAAASLVITPAALPAPR